MEIKENINNGIKWIQDDLKRRIEQINKFMIEKIMNLDQQR
jgi:hypothetical protein